MQQNKPKLLIIDDDQRNVFALSLVLKTKGYAIVSATEAKTGLELLDNDPDINIVLVDMMMPEMDGYEMLAVLKKDPPPGSKTYIAVTAQAMPGDREKCLAAGADDYISKPVDIDVLIEKLAKYV